MKVYHAIASARPVEQARECFSAWRDMGYGVASIRDQADLDLDFLLTLPEWRGVWTATNTLAAHVLEQDPECQVVVAAGDDVWPDHTKRADEIAGEFVEHFHGTLGVMQPGPLNIDATHKRLCWSPWLGREWCRRAFCGVGPTEPRFFHYFGDAYLQLVAERLGLLWECRHLAHDHRNWKVLKSGRPLHLLEAANRWGRDKYLFNRLVAEGFPGAGLAPSSS
jgi:hypothetical protein